MDMNVIMTVIVTVGTLVVAWLTRRTAKDTTAIGGFTDLTKALQEQVDRQGKRISSLESAEERRRQLARRHEIWDWQMASKLRNLTTDPVPDPPPLDVWE